MLRKVSGRSRPRTLAIIESSAKRGAAVVKQLMTFGRAGGEKVVVQIRHLIDDLVRIASQTFPKTSRSMPGSRSLDVIGDPTRSQVVLNLTVNAPYRRAASYPRRESG